MEKLFSGKKNATMFLNKDIFVIHKLNKPCGHAADSTETVVQIDEDVLTFISSTYPKQKFLPLIFKILLQNKLIDSQMFIVNFQNIHIADLCTFINNAFGKLDKTEPRFIKLCKYLQSLSLKFPKISVKNPVAQKFLC